MIARIARRMDTGTVARGAGRLRRALVAAGLASLAAAPVVSLATSAPAAAASFPTSHTLNLSFLEDPGQPPDPDVYYAGEGLLLTRNLYQGLLQYKSDTANKVVEPQLATSWSVSKDGLDLHVPPPPRRRLSRWDTLHVGRHRPGLRAPGGRGRRAGLHGVGRRISDDA